MKFVAWFFLLGTLGLTWNGYRGLAEGVSVITHFNLQNELRQFIADYVKSHAPGVEQVSFVRFWTEPVEKGQVRAVFEYEFTSKDEKGESVSSRINGLAYLSPVAETQNWSLERVEVNDQVIEFQTDTVITPDPHTGSSAPGGADSH